MPVNRRRNGQFAPDFSGKNNVPTSAPLVPSGEPTRGQLKAGGRKGAELRTKTFLSHLLGVSPNMVDTSGKQSLLSQRANWFFNGVITIGNERVQLRTKLFVGQGSNPSRMKVTVHEPGRNGRELSADELSAMKTRLQKNS